MTTPERFLDAYYEKKIYENDPFARLDQIGVGKLVETAMKLGKQTRPDIKLGICGDPSSIDFCQLGGLCVLLTGVPRAGNKNGRCRELQEASDLAEAGPAIPAHVVIGASDDLTLASVMKRAVASQGADRRLAGQRLPCYSATAVVGHAGGS